MTKYIKFIGTKFSDILGISASSLEQKLLGKAGDDVLSGGDGNDKFKGNNGDDWIAAGGGNDDIDGGKNFDIAVYRGRFSEYSLAFKSNLNGTVQDLTAGRDGTDALKKVEFLKFSDGIYDIASDTFQFFNQAPTLAAPAGITYSDSAAHDTFGPVAAALSASDPNGDMLTYSLGGDDADNSLAGFNVSKSTGYGTMYLNSATGAYTFVPVSSEIDALKITSGIDFTLTVSDGELSDSKTLTVTMNGVNDPASITGQITGTVIAGSEITAAGTLTLNDRDVVDQFLLATSSPTGTYGGFMFDGVSGGWSYTVSSDAPNVQSLGANDTEHDTLIVTSLDGTASVTIDVAVQGVNDNATITGGSTGNVAEDGVLAANGQLTVNDVDSGEEHFQVPMPASLLGTYGSFTFNAASGAWSYSLANSSSAVQGLGAGSVPVHDTLTVTSADGTASRTIDVTIAGNNDQPALQAAVLASQEPAGDPGAGTGSLTLTLTMAFSDIDWTDPHSVTLMPVGSGYVGEFTPVVTTNSTNGADGSVTLTYHLTQQQIMIAGGFPDQQDYLVTIDDHHGGVASQTVSIPLGDILDNGGEGDLPQPPVFTNTPPPNTFVISQNLGEIVDNPTLLNPPASSTNLVAQGTLTFSDPDGGNHHASVGLATVAGHFIVDSHGIQHTLTGSLIIGTWQVDVQEPNLVQWTYTVPESAARSMSGGETLSLLFPVTIAEDGTGHSTQTVRIDLFGTDEATFLLAPDTLLTAESSLLPYLLPPDQLSHLHTDNFSISEDPSVTGSAHQHTLSGTISFVDPDWLDIPTVSMALTDPGVPLSPEVQALRDGFDYTVEQFGNFGMIHWTYKVQDSELDFLLDGATQTVGATFNIGALPGGPGGGGSLSTVNVTLHGANDFLLA